MKNKIFLLAILSLLAAGSFSQNLNKSLSINVSSVFEPGKSYSFDCFKHNDLYNTTPETVINPEISFSILDDDYFPNSDLFSVFGNIVMVSKYIDKEMEVELVCKFENLSATKIIKVLPSNNNLNGDKYAILFIHGLAGNLDSWDDFSNELNDNDSRFIKCQNYICEQSGSIIKKPNSILPTGGQDEIPLFNMQLSDNKNLTFVQQGDQVDWVIKRINDDYGKDYKFVLFAHSMGGLAARAYMQKYGSGQVAGLVTAATPHAGSFLAYISNDLTLKTMDVYKAFFKYYYNPISQIPQSLSDSHNEFIKNNLFYGLDLNSRAIQYLQPTSYELSELRKQNMPYEVPIVNVASIWKPDQVNNQINNYIDQHFSFLEFNINNTPKCLLTDNQIPNGINIKGSDGVVPYISQLINSGIANSKTICPKMFITNKLHTNVQHDIKYMKYAMNAIINSIKEREDAKPSYQGKTFIGFILDSSGSMSENDPNNIRKTAVNQILTLLSGNESVFIVDFDDNAKWLNETDWTNWDLNKLQSYVRSIDSRGGTNIGSGLNKMKEAIDGRVSENSFGGILLFTDGKGNYNAEADWFAKHNIPIHTISYTNYADANTLNKIAETTGGFYLMANDEQDVITALSDYFNSLVGYDKICTYSNIINQDETVEYAFYMDYYTDEMLANNLWSGSTVGMTLISPNGTVYEENGLGTWVIEDTYASVKISKPEGGKWKAIFRGIQIPQGGEPFHFEVSGDTPNEFDLINKKEQTGQIVFNLSEVNNSLDISNIEPNIVVNSPNNNTSDISNNYSNGRFNFFPNDGEGNYNFRIDFKAKDQHGNIIQRQFYRTILIGDANVSYIAQINNITGTMISTSLGKWVGNRPGIECVIYSPLDTTKKLKAKGKVTFVMDNRCQIEMTEFFGGLNAIKVGDIVELDLGQWRNDN